ncbi:hypothetical protein K450DRAFT_200998 [Umbelopsis ramanniana AG]|uniref:Uncharacterized protein n=1 Tax=Umbelopsis ramanniana AG TaxID=1314678 RepID=A0AAD5HB59_UMBRA|nr:uncharacterized protein K450DRAFT_200998 [Umbelopsis ramanniana AG]KAI8577637.1 hypothetical protein K450DRAFT_200998 [Umbelopsis ramanniana AG]
MDASAAKPIAIEISNQLSATTAINRASCNMLSTPTLSKKLSNADKAITENQGELSKAQTAYIKTREENQGINAILDDIKQQSLELEKTFEQIDQLEMFVNHVKDTFNQVADCVGSMEKSVLANSGLSVGSIPMSFKFVSVFGTGASG